LVEVSQSCGLKATIRLLISYELSGNPERVVFAFVAALHSYSVGTTEKSPHFFMNITRSGPRKKYLIVSEVVMTATSSLNPDLTSTSRFCHLTSVILQKYYVLLTL
jgi:amino acid permease